MCAQAQPFVKSAGKAQGIRIHDLQLEAQRERHLQLSDKNEADEGNERNLRKEEELLRRLRRPILLELPKGYQ